MKKLLLVVLFSTLCWSQSPITITGTVVDSSNNIATNGYVQFALSPLNQGLAYQVPPSTIIASTSKCSIDNTGQPVNSVTGVAPCLVWPNDLIQPSNTLYTVTIAPNGHVTRVYNNVLLKSTNTPQSLALLTFIQPQPVVGTIIGGSPLVTMTVIPNLDLVWTLGDPAHRYAHVYANVLDDTLTNLTVTNLHVLGFIDNPNPGQDLLLQDNVHITGELKLDNCITFNVAGPSTTRLCPSPGGPFNQTLPAVSGGIAPLDSPFFLNNPRAPTPAPASSDNSIATTAFVQAFVAPTSPVTSVFGRIGAVAAAGGDYIVAQVTGAAPINNPVLTGDPQAPTPAPGDSDTSIATTAFVTNVIPPTPGGVAKARVNVVSCTLAANAGQWNCSGTITWGVTLPSTTYYAECALSAPFPTGSFPIPSGHQANFYWKVKTATTMTYAINDDHSGSNGAKYNLSCIAIN